jgi:hypothetical protein
MSEVVTKSEYARRHGVTPGAVTAWLARGHLSAEAVTADGRINVEIADAQLRERLDHARHATDVDHPPAGDDAVTTPAAAALIERQRLQRIEESDLRLRRLRREELEHAGTLANVDTMGKVIGRRLQELWASLERWGQDQLLAELRRDIAAGGNGIEVWRREVRAFRAARAEADERLAVALPELIGMAGDV